MAPTRVAASAAKKNCVDLWLNLAAEVRPGEAGTALLLALNAFSLLAACYLLKPVREALILAGGGAEIKSYSGAVAAALLLFIIPAFGAFASRVNRIRLITGVSLFFIATLLMFCALTKTTLRLGVPFYLWVGIFNVMVVAQFWSFANDLYTEEEGKRLFAIVGVGSATGAIAGAKMARYLAVDSSMLAAAAVLALGLVLTRLIDHRERGLTRRSATRPQVIEPLGREGGFQLALRQRYLLLIGLLTMVIQMVNTNGEYVLGCAFKGAAKAAIALGAGASEKQLINAYYTDFYFWQNLLVAVLQLFLVSRIIKRLGVSRALFVPPLLSLGGWGLIVAAPMLAAIRLAKLVENSTDYSLENTLRHSLFLPTSREAKYKAKQVVDSFFWRAGDMLSAVTVFACVRLYEGQAVAAVNAGLGVFWLLLVGAIVREHRRLAAGSPLDSPVVRPRQVFSWFFRFSYVRGQEVDPASELAVSASGGGKCRFQERGPRE